MSFVWNRCKQGLGLALCAALAFGAGDAFAQKKKKGGGKKKGEKKGEHHEGGDEEGGYKQPYGMAGCGLGSVVIKSNTKFPQLIAATLNNWASQTSAISCTQSSNCQQTKTETAQMEQEVFIATNLRSIEKDVSAGGGQFTEALAQVMGCTDSGEYDRFLEVSRANYGRIFASGDAKAVTAEYQQVLRSDEGLAKGCDRVVLTM